MSFIYDDPNLVDQLLKSGLEYQLKFTKKGQAVNAALSNDQANLNVLLTNLEQSAAAKDPNAGPEISYEGKQKPRYDDSSLESLGALVQFLAFNKITVDGKRAAYNSSEATPELENNQDYHFYKLEGNAGLVELGDRSKMTNGYFVNKDLLVRFIQSRQAALATRPNTTEEVQLKALIQEANDLLDTKISETFDPSKQQLDPKTPVDTIPNPINESSVNAPGTVQLLLQDVQSPQSLNDWLNDNNISIAVGNGQSISSKDIANFDNCIVIRFLHARSKAMLAHAGTKDVKRMQAYVNQIQTIGPSVTGKDGKACKLTGVQQTGQQSGSTVTQEDLANLANSLPLDREVIDFDRIKNFFSLYEQKILSKNNDDASTNASNNIQRAIQLMGYASSLTKTGLVQFYTSSNWSHVRDMLQPPVGQAYIPFLEHLQEIVELTGAVIGTFYARYVRQDTTQDPKGKPRVSLTPQQKAALEFQFLGGSCIMNQNLTRLQGLANNRDKVINIK